jgi:putative ABC transport system ATP-binding protein
MVLRARDVSLVYDKGKEYETHALDGVDLELKPGRLYGILGPSGCGKSSLLYVLSGLKKPTGGDVFFNGQNYRELKDGQLSALRKERYGFIFQRHFLIEYLDSLQNVLVPLNSNQKDDIDKARELLCAFGLEKEIYKKPYRMSGGQRQRVAIARALINNPEVLFADELTASLDHKNAFEVMEILGRYKKNTAILAVTHDKSILSGADNIIRLWDGKIMEKLDKGGPDETA